ncbi:DUF1992 domain-containing protein [Dactylosporangium sucinum]|uniref:DnaJ homologue subfamily C member 28 conserved domain-containing protein n=1 Tax=Dactylosporangium sucinum TaxID=1424081 RepID=A0A917TKF3_9ACTN|nr:DUF1992 domain-containing protein [Dactylosporangium sucinum]GGM25489.1 hypothetical protein GCM10007977_028320 [Dactylosporangium sucinum]
MTSWYESHIDKLIREAQEQGQFDNLPGAGKPLPDHGELYDEDWWLKSLAHREDLAGGVPPTLRLRREVEDFPSTLRKYRTEERVRCAVAELNDRIERARRGLIEGPPTVLRPLDVEAVLRDWRSGRA